MDVTLRLNRGQEGLDELLAGDYCSRVWVEPVEGEPGVYTIATFAADQPEHASTLALLHFLADAYDGEQGYAPPPLPMSPEVEDLRDRWAALIDGLPGGDVE